MALDRWRFTEITGRSREELSRFSRPFSLFRSRTPAAGVLLNCSLTVAPFCNHPLTLVSYRFLLQVPLTGSSHSFSQPLLTGSSHNLLSQPPLTVPSPSTLLYSRECNHFLATTSSHYSVARILSKRRKSSCTQPRLHLQRARERLNLGAVRLSRELGAAANSLAFGADCFRTRKLARNSCVESSAV